MKEIKTKLKHWKCSQCKSVTASYGHIPKCKCGSGGSGRNMEEIKCQD